MGFDGMARFRYLRYLEGTGECETGKVGDALTVLVEYNCVFTQTGGTQRRGVRGSWVGEGVAKPRPLDFRRGKLIHFGQNGGGFSPIDYPVSI